MCHQNFVEGGFEPSVVLLLHTLSKRANLKQSIEFLRKIKGEKLKTESTKVTRNLSPIMRNIECLIICVKQ